MVAVILSFVTADPSIAGKRGRSSSGPASDHRRGNSFFKRDSCPEMAW
jgi:hypothetical protein